jgi:hypothetical protein
MKKGGNNALPNALMQKSGEINLALLKFRYKVLRKK